MPLQQVWLNDDPVWIHLRWLAAPIGLEKHCIELTSDWCDRYTVHLTEQDQEQVQ